jgi:hypothetical protein
MMPPWLAAQVNISAHHSLRDRTSEFDDPGLPVGGRVETLVPKLMPTVQYTVCNSACVSPNQTKNSAA